MKRNIQEIYGGGPTGPGSNGNGSNGATLNNNNSNGNHHYHHQQQQQQTGQINDPTSNQDAKKSRLEQQPANKQDPSRVVHLRNIPHQLSEQEIVYLGLYFGNIVNVLFLRAKNQAFLEFESLSDAQNMIAHFATTSTTFSGKKIFVQYSNHQELNTDPSNASNLAAQNALSDAVQLHRAAREGGKATVLRATILNMLYPVTLDVLTQIFSKFGPIVKMITFNKNDKFQALVQLRDAMAANNAKMALNGQNIYTGCCTLQIDYSKLTNLEVRFNNDKSRDFTNPMLPTGDGTGHNQGGEPGSGNGQMNNNSNGNGGNNMQQPYHHQQQQSLIGNPPGMFGNNNNSQQSMNPMQNSYGGNQNLGANVGQMGGHPMMNPNMYQPSQQMNQGGGYGGGGMGPGIMNQQGGGPGMMMGGGQSMNNSQQSGGGQQLPQPGQTSVLLISNLNEECVNTDALFTLFGVYGDVTRVKILFNKKDSALINFANPQQAATALANLDRAKLWNKQIRVFASKHTTVQMPKDGQPDSGLTKDYSTSPLHRFKKPGSKNFNNIFPPSATLHLSNIPPNVTEQQLRELFQKYGQVKAFKFFQKDRKMALIQMGSAEEATHALIASHNYQLADNMHLRCTFSKATV